MPEIGEVARTVHYIRKHLVGKTLAKVTGFDDPNVYGKVGTSAAEFQKHMSGKKIVDAGQQGKYFWMIMSTPPHPVMHFGMAGWLKMKSEDTYYNTSKSKRKDDDWPPKYCKFLLETKAAKGEDVVEAAFVDMRRFARIRLVDCPAEKIRQVSPLVENGPDPVIDKDIVTVEWLMEKCRSKKVPIKAMLLDQANISGIGNWVGDEIMYDAKMHPEQYANSLSDEQIFQLHKSIHYICDTAVELLADSEKFPKEWIFSHRWGKGRRKNFVLPNGEKFVYLTVGGRTSAVVPSIQKKTGPVAKEMSEADDPEGAESGDDVEEKKPKKGRGSARKRPTTDTEEEDDDEEESGSDEDQKPKRAVSSKRQKVEPQRKGRGKKVKAEGKEDAVVIGSRKDKDLPDRSKGESKEDKPKSGRAAKMKVENDDEPPPSRQAKKSNDKTDSKTAASKKNAGSSGGTTKNKKNGNSTKVEEPTPRRRSGRLSGIEASD